MNKSQYFTEDEMKCQHCGASHWDSDFMDWLDSVRFLYGKPMVVSSGYRCPEHPIEKKKSKPGAHSTGKAVDIAVSGGDALKLIEIAIKLGCQRVGVNQKGNGRFIHLDLAGSEGFPQPAIWSY